MTEWASADRRTKEELLRPAANLDPQRERANQAVKPRLHHRMPGRDNDDDLILHAAATTRTSSSKHTTS
ncbi:hypothetical protein O9K51_05319 [Purpureocillium lavendulum]|uniref:Uncharacterized protein n=1 Tax=Purpureocillium lavendulum TaxID=1247861 RepID=A0AB34FSF3_9HYPO|nr:hypothetical protein O9K51_05319 [Purpureocillium lavendulum]